MSGKDPIRTLERIALKSKDRVIDIKEPSPVEPSKEYKPIVLVKQELVPLVVKRQDLAHIFYDAKLEDREQVRADAKAMDWDLFSKVTSRFDTTKEVKLDHTITAMGLLGLLTGSDD
jgi:hypothetical protein